MVLRLKELRSQMNKEQKHGPSASDHLLNNSLLSVVRKRRGFILLIAFCFWQLRCSLMGQDGLTTSLWSRDLFAATSLIMNMNVTATGELFPTETYHNNNNNKSLFTHNRTATANSRTVDILSTSLDEDLGRTRAVVDCGCPNTCTAEALDNNRLVPNQLSTQVPFTCRQRINLYIDNGMSEREACSITFNESFTPCGSSCDPNQCLPVEEPKPQPVVPTYKSKGIDHILIVAAVPRSSGHTVALWSELECLALPYDQIIISSPEWSRPLMDDIVQQAQDRLQMNIQAQYFVNDRYDVGLWCDALQVFLDARGMDTIRTVTLLNDSVYAFRNFSGILSALEERPEDLDMVGMNYYNNSDSYWLESVLRGFPIRSVPVFLERVCQAPREMYCPRSGPIRKKRCIVENFEIAVAANFLPNRTLGLFPSNPPSDWPRADKIWAEQPIFWKTVLVEGMGFPLAKVKVAPTQLQGPTDPKLKECTKSMNHTLLLNFNYSRLMGM